MLSETKPDPLLFSDVPVPEPGFPEPTRLEEPVISTVCTTAPFISSFKEPLLASENEFATWLLNDPLVSAATSSFKSPSIVVSRAKIDRLRLLLE